MNAKPFFSIDSTKGIAKLLIPGSKFYLLRPNGFGKSTLIKKLSKFIQGGEERKKIIHENTWLFQNKKALLNNFPSMPTIELDCNNLTLDSDAKMDPNGFLEDKILAAQEIFQTKKKVALLIDNYDAPYLNQDIETSKFIGDILKSSCDYHDNVQYLSYIFVTGVYRIGEENTYASLMRMKDLSLDLYHHDTTGISDSEIRNYFSLNDNWLSDHGKRFQINNMQKQKKESDGNNANSDIVNNNSNSDNIVPERLRSFKWNDEIGDREEIVLDEDNNNNNNNNIIHLLDEDISDVDKTTISNITAQGKYWWGGYDNDGRHELIHPYTSIKDNNASKLMLQLQNVGIPSKYQFKSLVNSILYDIPFDMLLQSKFNFHDDSTSSLQIANDIHLPSLLVQHGLLTLESRAAVVREFHSEVFIRLCFPNEFCQDEVVTMTLGTWMGFTLEKIELVKSTLQSIHMELMSLSLENESKLLDHFESLRKIILEESYLNDLASSTVTGNSFSDDFSSSSMLITDEQVRSYLFLFLLSCIPNIQVSRTDPIYLEGGASDTFVHEETVGNVDSNHGNTISIEKNLLKNSLVFSLSSDDESSKTSCVRIKSINGDVIDLDVKVL